MSSPSPLPGPLSERYRVERELGRGGFGVVLRARDLELDRPVAIKLLTTELDAEMQARFTREARATAALDHPRVVRVYDHGLADGTPYIVYELVTGSDLLAVVAERGRPDPEQALAWAIQGAEALEVLHAAGLVHRDVKPENMLVRESGELVLCDLGIVRPELGEKLTATGMILGTPAYMAPELFHGEPASPASDQFGWAASLVDLLTGRPVYGSRDPGAVITRLADAAPFEVPEGLRREYPELAPALARALARRTGTRFPSMGAFREALGRSDVDGPEVPPPVPRGSGLLVGAVLLGGLAFGFMPGREPGPPPSPSPAPTRVEPAPEQEIARTTRAVDEAARRLWEAIGEEPDRRTSEIFGKGGSPTLARRLVAPRVLDRWGEMLRSVPPWLEALHSSGRLPSNGAFPPELSERYDRVVERTCRALEGFRKVLVKLRIPDILRGRDIEDPPSVAEFEAVIEAMAEDARVLQRALGELPAPRSLQVEFLRLKLADESNPEDFLQLTKEVLRMIRTRPKDAYAGFLLGQASRFLVSEEERNQLSCEQEEEIYRLLHDAAEAVRAPAARPLIGARLLDVESRRRMRCPEADDPPRIRSWAADVARWYRELPAPAELEGRSQGLFQLRLETARKQLGTPGSSPPDPETVRTLAALLEETAP